jgi:hypothetical protein
MNVTFSIDALDAAASHAWRLQRDGQHWRACVYAEPLVETDARLSPPEAEKLNGHRMRPDKELGLVMRGKPGMFDFLMSGIFSHAILHRFTTPPIPSQGDMLASIAALTPGTPWLLYLDAAAHFRALDSNRERIIGNLGIAVRGEIASAAGYVGPEAVKNATLMDRTWRQFLGGWLEHLQSGHMSVFVPDVEKLKSEADYLKLIQEQQPEPIE